MVFSDAISTFLLYCKLRRLSEHTQKAYRSDLTLFKTWSNEAELGKVLSSNNLMAWRVFLDQRQFAPTTIKRRMAALQAITKWLEKENLIPEDPFRRIDVAIKLPRRLPRNLHHNDLKLLLRELGQPTGDNPFFFLLMKLTVELILSTGIRIAEACSISLRDIDLDARTIRIAGKGSRERQVFLVDEELVGSVKQYQRYRNRKSPVTDRLLVTTRGTAASPDYIRRKLHEIVGQTKISGKVTPHMLRHTAATQLLESGVDIRFVQRLLGHSSIATTEIYTHVSNAALRDAIFKSDLRRQWE